MSDVTHGEVGNYGFLKKVEQIGNKLPNPAILFLLFFLILAVISAILANMNISAIHPMTHKVLPVKSLLSAEGAQWFFPNMIKNYIDFPPLGMIMVLTMGIGLLEKTGLLNVCINGTIKSIPAKYITFTIVFLSFMSHVASDAAIVIVPPIAAMVYYSLGRHPFAGFAISLAAIYSGFTANILIVTTDVLLSGISTQAAQIIDPHIVVNVTDNWYFMSFSVIFHSLLLTYVSEHFFEPKLGKYEGTDIAVAEIKAPTALEKKALKVSGVAVLIFFAIVALLVVPEGAILRNPQTGGIAGSPFVKSIVSFLFVFFLTAGLSYGITAKTITSGDVAIKMMTECVRSLAGFLVMVFGIAQFIAAFTWTNIATLIATSGASFLESIGMTGLPAFLLFMLFGQFMGLFIASGSAIWALLSPVFVPMFMLLGYHPAFIQVAFRAGDGALNTIQLVNPFLPLFIETLQRYKKDSGIGTYLSLMMPYALLFFVLWYSLFIAWYLLGLPPGPGVGQYL